MNHFKLFFLIFLVFNACTYEHPTVPNVSVDFTIWPNDPNYYELIHYGGYVYVTGGVDGIIIYRLDEMTFKAYDRACPYDWETSNNLLWVDDDRLTIYHEDCGSRFNIIDGTVVEGPARTPLKYYRTRYDGAKLRIYN